MTQYIDKSAVVAEIKRLNREAWELYGCSQFNTAYDNVLQSINTLEVKKVNLEKHLKEDIENVFFDLDGVAVKGTTSYLTVEGIKDIAKHFFELGMAASNKVQKGEQVMKDIKEIINNVESLRKDILDYITSTEHCLFNWISNKAVQDFIKKYPEDYEYMFHLSVININASPLIRITFDEHPDDIPYIERYTVLPTFRETTKARWMEWNGKVKELQISEKEKELNYYKKKVGETEKEIEELKKK